ncbi:MAG: SCP2 sterol-binding domain-containing protein [Pseudomonadota bacterium]
MTLIPTISILVEEGITLNGMGQMMRQYLEQNLADFPEKVEQALRLRYCISVEVERGIASTIRFEGETICLQNGVAAGADLQLKGSYHTLAKILCGQVNPLGAILKGRIKVMRVPRRPVQALRTLRFLQIPPELLMNSPTTTQQKKTGRTLSTPAVLSILLLLALCFIYIGLLK